MLEPGDTFDCGIEDTMVAGAGLNDPATASSNARLAELGVPFTMEGNLLNMIRAAN